MRASTVFWGVVLTCATASSAWSQSLGDIAKREEERRKALKTAAKVYTNGDLPPVPVSTPEQPPAEAADAKGAAVAAKAADEAAMKADAQDAAPSIDQGEEYWRKLMSGARELRARSDTYLEALRIRVEALTNDFYAQADPAVRSSIAAQRNRVFDDMERLKQDMADQDAAIAKIEADATKANVPPGWIR